MFTVHWDNFHFTPDDRLNHDVATAMARAYEQAVKQLERDWQHTVEYATLSWKR